MALLGDGKINSRPCTPEDEIANWQIQATINEQLSEAVSLDSFKVKVTEDDTVESFLDSALPLNKTFDANADIAVFGQILDYGGGDLRAILFLDSDSVTGYSASGVYVIGMTDGVAQWLDATAFGGSGSDDKTVLVSAADTASGYLHTSMASQATYSSGADLPIHAAINTPAGDEKLQLFIDASAISGDTANDTILLGKSDDAWVFVSLSEVQAQYTLVSGQVVGNVGYGVTSFTIDNVAALAGGVDPSSGNPATAITVTRVQKEAFPDNTPIMAVFDGGSWDVLDVERRRMVRGKVVGNIGSSAGVFNIDDISALCSGIDPRTDPTSAAETLEITNAFNASYTDDQRLWCVFNSSTRNWEPLQASSSGSTTLLFGKTTSEISAATDWDVATGAGSGTWQQLDENGNAVGDEGTVSNRYFDSIPVGTPIWVSDGFLINAGCSAGPA